MKKISLLISIIFTSALAFPQDFVHVKGGTFLMGSDASDHRNERPVHQVIVDSFEICIHEVTQAEYQAATGKNPSKFKEADRPVECVTWYDAVEYCNSRSIAEGLKPCYTKGSYDSYSCDWEADGYRLPTEAEWEYACRGGSGSKGFTYSGSNDVKRVAWYDENPDDDTDEQTHKVMKKAPNELGIYDMSGNVWEWCWDGYGFYSSASQVNPTGYESSQFRSLRGGAYDIIDKDCSVTIRENGAFPSLWHQSVGFRVARKSR